MSLSMSMSCEGNINVLKAIVNFKTVQMHLLRSVEIVVVLSSEIINKPQKVNFKFSKVNLIKSRIY